MAAQRRQSRPRSTMGTGSPGGETFMGHPHLLPQPGAPGASLGNTSPELNHFSWPCHPGGGRELGSKAPEQSRDKGAPGVAVAAAWLLRPASILRLTAAAAAAGAAAGAAPWPHSPPGDEKTSRALEAGGEASGVAAGESVVPRRGRTRLLQRTEGGGSLPQTCPPPWRPSLPLSVLLLLFLYFKRSSLWSVQREP